MSAADGMVCHLEQAIHRKVRTASGGLAMQSEKQASEIADVLAALNRSSAFRALP
jgi:hypothetical protein